MREFNDLWDWLVHVQESYAFLIALPSFVALFLACIADWAERHLAAFEEPPSHERGSTLTGEAKMAQEQWHASMHRRLSGRL
jgi:hypothetical protein